MQASYGVDPSQKQSANPNNPYDFNGVQVSI